MRNGFRVGVEEFSVYFLIGSHVHNQKSSESPNKQYAQKNLFLTNVYIIVFDAERQCAIQAMRHAHHYVEVEQVGVGECEIAGNESSHCEMTCNYAQQLKSEGLEVGEDFMGYDLEQELVHVVRGADVPLDP